MGLSMNDNSSVSVFHAKYFGDCVGVNALFANDHKTWLLEAHDLRLKPPSDIISWVCRNKLSILVYLTQLESLTKCNQRISLFLKYHLPSFVFVEYLRDLVNILIG
jgi:hypothetical protein